MINGFKVITLCGSTRFKNEFMEAQKRLTLEGNVVITVGLYGHSGDDVVWTEGVKDMLDRQHLAKIDLADEIFVINVGGYIGDSTRREIAYAEFKGKTISYLEEGRKPSIYDNYAALGELHDAERIFDEDFEKAGRDFDEKRKALIAEYNACQGPWPYLWGNIDAVVCGILQQIGVVSIDYSDLKDLYDADYVYEIRIKGKGTNDEEQLQSIIDVIRSDYLAQLRSSKKVVVTLCGSSNPSGLLEKLADFMDGLNVVWQTRTLPAVAKEIETSIVYGLTISEMLKLWSEETINVYNPIAQKVKLGYYTQSVLSRIKRSPELLIFGINPGSRGGRINQDRDGLLEGNPCFHGLTDEDVIFELSKKHDKIKHRYGWDLWSKLHKLLGFSGKEKLLERLDCFVLSNMVFFGTDHEGDIPNGIDVNKCAKQSLKLIDILKPKIILLLGVKSKELFEKTKEVKMKEIEPNNLSYYKLGNIYVFAIKHTAYFYSDIKCEEISKTICYALDNPDKFEDKFKLVQLKHKIDSNGTIQWINSEGKLVHEYFCKGNNGKYERGNGTISVGLKIDNKDNKYILSILSNGNHPKDFLAMVQGICDESKLFKKNADYDFVADIGTDDGKIVEFFNVLLAKIKEYRETDFPK